MPSTSPLHPSDASKPRIGGRNDVDIPKYLNITQPLALARPTFRNRLGYWKRYAIVLAHAAADMLSEFWFFVRHATESSQRAPEARLAALRKRAHVLEKHLMQLHGQTKPGEDFELSAQSRRMIEELASSPESLNDNTLPWILRLLKEQEWRRTTGWECDKRFVPRDKQDLSQELSVVMKRRRSVRLFQDRPVPSDLLRRVIEAATYAPSSCNRQPWRFLTVTEPTGKAMLSECSSGGHPWVQYAPVLVVTMMDGRAYRIIDDRFTMHHDAAAANQNMLLMAEALGLAACWVSLNSFSNTPNERELREKFGIPEPMVFAGLIALGYPAQWVCPIQKLSVDHVLHDERFGVQPRHPGP
jgi:nitroreductase